MMRLEANSYLYTVLESKSTQSYDGWVVCDSLYQSKF